MYNASDPPLLMPTACFTAAEVVERNLDLTQMSFKNLPALTAKEALSVMGMPHASEEHCAEAESTLHHRLGRPVLIRSEPRWRVPLRDLDKFVEEGILTDDVMEAAA